jgi:hypothetical protein
VSEGYGAGLFDFLQCASEFGSENWSAHQSGSDCCAQKRVNDAHWLILDFVFFMEPT